MTQKRIGKGISGRRDSNSGSAAGKWIIALLVINLILVVRLSWIVGKMTPSAPSQKAGRAVYKGPDEAVKETESSRAAELKPPPEGEDISPAEVPLPLRVEVLNGCGVAKLASKAADYLRSRGYDIRDVGNAKHKMYARTIIYLRIQNQELGEALAAAIGLSPGQVQIEPDPALVDIDATLIIGHDYGELAFSR